MFELGQSTLAATFSLAGRVAVVTGAAGLLGAEHCRALVAAGARVAALDIDEERCKRTAQSIIDDTDGDVFPFQVDIKDEEDVKRACNEILKWGGTIDVLVNNAAVNDVFDPGKAIPFEEFPLAAWQRSLDVNLTGAFLCSQRFGAEMAKQGSGSIINIASTYGVVAPNQSIYRSSDGTQRYIKPPAYSVTKAGMIALTKYLASYWGGAGVRVNALSPGGVRNGQDEEFIVRYAEGTMLGRMATPQDYAGAIVFLASDASAYMTGANLIVDGGWTAW